MTKFYKTVIKTTVLSDEPFQWDDLSQIHQSITDGECVGSTEEVSQEEITPKECSKLCLELSSDPEFFNLDEEGNELDW